jgi:hypothetical protein
VIIVVASGIKTKTLHVGLVFLRCPTKTSALFPFIVGLGLEVLRWTTTRDDQGIASMLTDNRRPCVRISSCMGSRLPSLVLKQDQYPGNGANFLIVDIMPYHRSQEHDEIQSSFRAKQVVVRQAQL